MKKEQDPLLRNDPVDEEGLTPEEALADRKQRNKLLLKLFFIVALCAVSIVIMLQLQSSLSNADMLTFQQMLQLVNVRYLLLSLGVLALMLLAEVLKYLFLIRTMHGKWMPKVSTKVMFLGRYYDNMTPASTGGQPFQAVYLHKRGLSAGTATAVPLARYFVSGLVWDIFGIVLMLRYPYMLDFVSNQTMAQVLRVGAWVGIALNAVAPFTIIFISFFPRFGKKGLLWILRLGAKLHLVKKYYTAAKKVLKAVDDYTLALKQLCRRFVNFIILVLLCIGELFLSGMFPYCIVLTIGGIQPNTQTMMEVMALSYMAQFAACYMPTPGGTGFAETALTVAFSGITLSANVLFWVVLIWRIFSYYIYIFIGIVLNITEICRDYALAAKNRRLLREKHRAEHLQHRRQLRHGGTGEEKRSEDEK